MKTAEILSIRLLETNYVYAKNKPLSVGSIKPMDPKLFPERKHSVL